MGTDLTGKKTTDMWYEEASKYNYRNAQFSTRTAHFTQVVWAGSTPMVAGRVVSSSGAQFVVARYSLAGNVRGTFEENVRQKGTSAVGGVENQGNFIVYNGANNDRNTTINKPWTFSHSNLLYNIRFLKQINSKILF